MSLLQAVEQCEKELQAAKQRELELLAVIKELREALTRISGYNLQSNPSTVAQDALGRTEHYQEGS